MGEELPQSLVWEWRNRCIHTFSTLFGGCEASTIQGHWVSEDGDLMVERVVVVSALSDASLSDDKQRLHNVKTLCKNMAEALNQECVLLSWTESGHTFIRGDKP